MCVDWCVCLPNLPSFVYIKSPFYPKFTRFFIPKTPPFYQKSTPFPKTPKQPPTTTPPITPNNPVLSQSP